MSSGSAANADRGISPKTIPRTSKTLVSLFNCFIPKILSLHFQQKSHKKWRYIYIYIRWICQYSVSSLVYQHSILSNIFHFLCCFHKSKTWLIKKVKIKISPLLQDNDVIKPRQTSERASCPPREQPRHPLQTENRQRISTLTVFLWARVDYASRASKKAPQGLFSPPDYSAGRCCSNPPA